MPDREAERAGPYRLLEFVGEGGMGVVRRALGGDDREVAVKLLKPELTGHADFRRRLAREVDTMRRVRSPYVAQVLDADVAGERPYVVTRFIRGRALDDVVRAGGPLSGEPLRRVAAGLADALVAIHGAGVVHRDLKPNNVMLVDGSPVVIDFGIAHAVDATRLTRLGQVVGTPGYMGPEIIEGAMPGPPVDVYGWAATVTFAASGRSPYGSGSLEAVLARVAAGRPDLDGVPARLEPLVRAALDRDPRRRPSAAELAARLRDLDLRVPETVVVPATVVVPERRPPLFLYKLFAYGTIVAASAASAVLPVAAVAGVVVAGWYLRAGDSALRGRRVPIETAADLTLAPARAPAGDRLRAAAVLLPTLAYAGLIAAMVGTALHVRGRLGGTIGSGATTKWTAFAFAYTLLAGPRVMAPRRQLVRLLSGVARTRWATAVAGVAVAGLAAGAVFAGWSSPPSFWPAPSPYPVLGRLADLVGDLTGRLP
ncbi:serine/threonine-protein kinase [Actinomadura sp. DC4]|uniref:serine/threonine-protein kinase n=1 Tax=Actinomadura sp. DC4 TaxID=3055069 RepID=UPI0025B18998|nr:serine/threonine-protein kinase [Actinomadura sp. DC4]MDN3358856.1 serine/threonine-protein kinase [Actinomadura sp. DC4]